MPFRRLLVSDEGSKKMLFQVAYHSNIGSTKKVNQDAVGFKEIEFQGRHFAMLIVCDGMGGLQDGEKASATVVRSLLDWFEKEFPAKDSNFDYSILQRELEIKIVKCNAALHKYGVENGIQLGTTLSTLLIRDDGSYLIANVGDSRIYMGNRENVIQITEDQTYIEREIKSNRMTLEEARESRMKNVLTQCIGVNEAVEVLFYRGKAVSNEFFLACSDGFRHFMTEIDLYNSLYSVIDENDEGKWTALLEQITSDNMNKGEKDNITSAIVKIQ